jgi:hypothetical protein
MLNIQAQVMCAIYSGWLVENIDDGNHDVRNEYANV